MIFLRRFPIVDTELCGLNILYHNIVEISRCFSIFFHIFRKTYLDSTFCQYQKKRDPKLFFAFVL